MPSLQAGGWLSSRAFLVGRRRGPVLDNGLISFGMPRQPPDQPAPTRRVEIIKRNVEIGRHDLDAVQPNSCVAVVTSRMLQAWTPSRPAKYINTPR